MSDENKQTPELEAELEELRDTFRAVLDETTANSGEPIIQELDYSNPPLEEDRENSSETESTEEAFTDAEQAPKAKKAKKKVPLAAVIIPVVLCLLFIIPLVFYVVLSVSIPNFSNFFSATSYAIFANSEEARIEKYNEALKYCTDDSKLASLKQFVLEEIVISTSKTQDYASAQAYMSENMSEEMLANPQSKEFKSFLALGDKLNEITAKIFQTAVDAVGDKETAEGIDLEALTNSLNTPESMKTSISGALGFLCEAVAGENAATEKEELQDALGLYLNANSVLSDMGADCRPLLEEISLKLYRNGFMYEANLVVDNLYKQNDTEEIHSENKAFTDMLADFQAVTGAKCDVYAIAVKAYEEGCFSQEEFEKTIRETLADNENGAISDLAIASLAQIGVTIAQGIDAQKQHNLTKATTYISTSLSALNAFELPIESIAVSAVNVFMSKGDTQTANGIKESFLSDFVPETDSDKNTLSRLDELYNAQSKAYEAFYPHYVNMSYGQAIDKATILADLDELITAETTATEKAFINYYKYFAVAITDDNKSEMEGYLTEFAKNLSEYPLLYGVDMGMLYVENGEIEKAVEIADKMLACDIADDYANSIKALSFRAEGNITDALNIAQKGIELSGANNYCTLESAICFYLLKDYDGSFAMLKDLFASSSLTVTACELVKLVEAAYDNENDAVKEEIAQYSAQVDALFENNGITASEKAKGIIDGKLTPEEVFMQSPYRF